MPISARLSVSVSSQVAPQGVQWTDASHPWIGALGAGVSAEEVMLD